jgi:hypothetical protein
MDNSIDKIKKYEEAVLRILNEYAQIKYSNIEGGNRLIADKENHRYQVVTIGWRDGVFVHDCPMHLEIIDGKIWAMRNMTEWDLGKMLQDLGVPKSDIVIGFLSPKMREFSDYAMG